MCARINRPRLQNYGVTLLAVGLASLAAPWLRHVPEESRFGLFLAVVMVSSWHYGWGPGLFATVLSSLGLGYFFLVPTHSLSVNANDIVRLAAFLLVALLITSLNAVRHRAAQQLRPVKQNPELCGHERTSRLSETVERLEKEIRELQRGLRESEERFGLFVEGVEDYAIFMLDPDGNVLSWNAGAERIEGYRAEEIIGRHFSCFYPDEDIRLGKPSHGLKVAAVQGRYEEEGWQLTKDDRRFWVAAIISALKDEQGNLRGFAKVTRNITQRKEAEEAVRESEQRLRAVFENSAIGIALTDLDGRFVVTNRAYQEMLGYTDEDLRSKSFRDLTHEDDLEASWAMFRRVIEGNLHDFRIEKRYRRKDGNLIWVRNTVSLIPTIEGAPLFVVTIVEDITERKHAEERLTRSREQLRSLSAHLQSVREEERTHIAREIHDELGQMLTGLKIDLSWLENRLGRNGDLKTRPLLVDKIRSMSNLVSSTIQTVRKISTELRPGVLDDLGLTAAIEWQGQEFQTRTGIKCQFDCNVEEVRLDPDRSTAVFRIFQETLTNVARHANASQVHIQLIEETHNLLLRVNDNGRGITKDEISDSKSLGILGVRERAILLGGKIRIRGAPGKGTSLTLWIPINKRHRG